MLTGIYAIVAEKSDEPCSAEFRGFSTKENAKREMDKLIEKTINIYELTNKEENNTRKSYKESKGESFVITVDEDDAIEVYYRIEYIPLEDI